MNKLDVAIIGGGPAAVICALELAHKGIRVGIIFRRHNRSTVELVSGRARRLLEQVFKKSLIELVKGVEIHETISLWDTPFPIESNSLYNPWGPGISVDRDNFDNIVLSFVRAVDNIEIFSNVFVQNVKFKENYWQISLQPSAGILLKSSFLALATGRTQIHWLQRTRNENQSSIVLMTRLVTDKTRQDNVFYIEATKKGWWYSLPDIYHNRFIGYYTSIDLFKQRQSSCSNFFFTELRNTRLIGYTKSDFVNNESIKGQFANMQTYDKVVGNGWISLGDAAFAPDPLSGMGLEFAIESAIRGAKVLQNGVKEITKNEYESWIRKYSIDHKKMLDFYRPITSNTL